MYDPTSQAGSCGCGRLCLQRKLTRKEEFSSEAETPEPKIEIKPSHPKLRALYLVAICKYIRIQNQPTVTWLKKHFDRSQLFG